MRKREKKDLLASRNRIVSEIADKFKDKASAVRAKIQEDKETLRKRTLGSEDDTSDTLFGKKLPKQSEALKSVNTVLAQMIMKKKELFTKYNATKQMSDFEEYVQFQKKTARFVSKKKLSDKEEVELAEILDLDFEGEDFKKTLLSSMAKDDLMNEMAAQKGYFTSQPMRKDLREELEDEKAARRKEAENTLIHWYWAFLK